MAGPHADRERYARLAAAFRTGDFGTLCAELGSIEGFPNILVDQAFGWCLIQAIYTGPLALVRDFLDAGADPNLPVADGFPPLIAALSCATPSPGAPSRDDVHELLGLLLARGADPGQRGINDYTPLHWAAGLGDLRAVDLLLAHGADPNAITRIDDMETAFEIAVAAGHSEVADRLRPLTVRPDWEDAARTGNIATLERLLRAGHDIDARDGYGQTALMRAAHAGQAVTVEWLVGRGADLNHTSKFRLSALMLAVIADHPQIARALVSAGADLTITGMGAPGLNGKTAADLAGERGNRRLEAYLRRRMSSSPS